MSVCELLSESDGMACQLSLPIPSQVHISCTEDSSVVLGGDAHTHTNTHDSTGGATCNCKSIDGLKEARTLSPVGEK